MAVEFGQEAKNALEEVRKALGKTTLTTLGPESDLSNDMHAMIGTFDRCRGKIDTGVAQADQTAGSSPVARSSYKSILDPVFNAQGLAALAELKEDVAKFGVTYNVLIEQRGWFSELPKIMDAIDQQTAVLTEHNKPKNLF